MLLSSALVQVASINSSPYTTLMAAPPAAATAPATTVPACATALVAPVPITLGTFIVTTNTQTRGSTSKTMLRNPNLSEGRLGKSGRINGNVVRTKIWAVWAKSSEQNPFV